MRDDLNQVRYFELCNAQLMMWFDAQVSLGDGYRLGAWFRTDQTFDPDILCDALVHLAQNHDALRLRIDTDKPRQWVSEDTTPPLKVIDIDDADPDAAFEAHMRTVFEDPMPFGDHPLWRVDFLRADGLSFVVLSFHHIIVDTISVQLALSQVLQSYLELAAGGTISSVPATSTFQTVLEADADYNASPQFQQDLAHWASRYETIPPRLITADPVNSTDPFADITFRDIPLDGGFLEAVQAANLLPHRALFGILAVVLARRFGQTDLSCGMALHRRDRSSLQTISMLAGLIPLRATFEDWWSLEDCIAAVSETLDEDLRHNRLPLDALYREIKFTGKEKRGLFDVTMSFVPGTTGFSFPPGSSSGLVETREASPISFHATSDSKTGAMSYRIAINPNYQHLIPSQALADVLDAAITQFAQGEWVDFGDVAGISGNEAELISSTLPLPCVDLLGDVVASYGVSRVDAPALALGAGAALRYGELAAAVMARAAYLGAHGVTRGTRVGVLVDLSVADQARDVVISLLAIWEAGGVFVPLNAEDPAARLADLVADAGMTVVACWEDRRALAASLGAQVAVLDGAQDHAARADQPRRVTLADDLAYIYFTSGTTGRPKGVPVSHGALAAFAAAIAQSVPSDADSVVLSAASPLFDALFMDLAASLARGGLLVRLSARHLASPGVVADAAAAHGATYLDLTPTVWRTVLSTGWVPPAGFTAVTGGEAIEASLATKITAQGARLYNSYGPTEATVVTVAGEIVADDIAAGQMPLGRPLAGTRALILDARMRPVAPGVPGTLYLGGPQLAQGYLGAAAQTAAAFVADPDGSGARLYNTGDLAVWGRDGRIGYLGRGDAQVKIRGMRVELGEIAAVLEAQPGVDAAAALVQDGAIVAFVVVSDDADRSDTGACDLDPDVCAALQAALAAALPVHMRPRAIGRLAALPLNAAGKLDRRALDGLATDLGGASHAPFAAPEGPLETLIAGHVRALLEQETGRAPDQISRHDSFFDLGGHSLMAVRLIARLEAESGASLPLRALFEAPTLKDLALALASAQSQTKLPPLTRANRDTPLPLSYAQERLWFVDKLDPEASAAYRIDGALRLSGSLNAQALKQAFEAVVDRHESLRTRFSDDGAGNAVSYVAATAQDIGFALATQMAEDDLEGQVIAFLNAPYDLARGPLFRALLLDISEDEYVLAVGGHHAILDGWSVAMLFGEVAAYYDAFTQGHIVPLTPLPLQYGDYAVWQRSLLDQATLAAEADWWRDTLIGAPDAIDLPTDRPRPEKMDYRGRSVRATLPRDVLDALSTAARGENASLFMGLQAALSAYLMRVGAGEDIVLGTAVAGRPAPELDPMVGFFINTVALRNTVVPAQSFRGQVAHAKDVTLDAFDHQDLPFDAVIEAVRPVRSMAHAPVVQVMLILQNVPRASEVFDLGGLEVDYFLDRMADKGAQFDMAFECAETEDGLDGILTYATALFDDETAQRLLDGFFAFVTAAARAPDMRLQDLPVMSDATQKTLTGFENAPVLAQDPTRVPDLIAQAALEATAVVDELGGVLTYKELHAQADKIAAAMQQAGVGEGSVVALCLTRNVTLPAAILAAWKIGAAFIPLNPNDPVERRAYMLDTAQACLIVTDAQTRAAADDVALPCLDLDMLDANQESTFETADGHLAYVIFTSGSTGKPKGVAVSHASLAHLQAAVMQDDPMGPADCLISGFENTFDVFVRDVALTLAAGAKLVLAQTRRLLKPGHFAGLVESHKGTWLQLTPTVWRVALQDGWRPDATMRAEAGGEAMDANLAKMLGENGAKVVNAYGPTEVTAVSVQGVPTPDDLKAGDAIAIGKPLPGLRAYVLDRNLQPVPPGVPGELVLAGPQVADGYIGRPALTAEVFIADPIARSGRAYRTGDLVRWRNDGRLDFLGRIDAQVKIRGMRIELGEIETAIAALPYIRAAAVAAQPNGAGQTSLVAYIVQDGQLPDSADEIAPDQAQDIRSALAKSLPEYMIPQVFTALSELPLTPSGKLDRKALPVVEAKLVLAEYVPLEGPTEKLVADEIAQLLGENASDIIAEPDRIGRHDSFFALGGHSLLAMQLINRLEAATGLIVPLRTVFESVDIAELSATIDRLLDGEMPGAESEVDDAQRDIDQVQGLPNAPDGTAPSLADANCVLLTGATGFLGRYLLRDLLDRTRGDVICVVRADTPEAAKTRVLSAVNNIPGVTLTKAQEARIIAIPGELSKPQMGLAPRDLARIIADVDIIVHNGAEVHAMKPYAMLRASNTLSVLDLLHIMSEGRAKQMIFVSTLGTLEVELDQLKDGFDPQVMTPSDDSGYNLSKWAAERMLITARDKGYQSIILRPGLVIGCSETGYYQTSDIGNSYTSLFLDTGSVPDAMSSFGLPWVNVDRASEMILELGQSGLPDGIGHVFDHGAMPSDVLAEVLGVEVLPTSKWLARAIAVLEADNDHPSSWLLARLRGQAADLEGIPDEMIPVENAASMFKRFAPPALPQTISDAEKPTPQTGIAQSIKWLKNRTKE